VLHLRHVHALHLWRDNSTAKLWLELALEERFFRFEI
jgi:hypothetical protein